MTYSKEERDRNISILLATLTYLLEYHTDDLVFDDYSPSKEWYLQELKQTELDIKKSRSSQIKRRLDKHIAILKSRYDQGIGKYISENTSYEIDLFESIKADVLSIIKKGNIDDNDVYLVENYLKAFAGSEAEQKNIAILNELKTKREAYLNNLVAGEDIITEKFHSILQGKKSWSVAEDNYEQFFKEFNKDWLLEEIIAPNGIDKLHIQFSGKGEQALTYINILLKGGAGSIYTAIGEKLPIKTFWKNNHTVVIETRSDFKFLHKYKQVSSYGDVIKIEYIDI